MAANDRPASLGSSRRGSSPSSRPETEEDRRARSLRIDERPGGETREDTSEDIVGWTDDDRLGGESPSAAADEDDPQSGPPGTGHEVPPSDGPSRAGGEKGGRIPQETEVTRDATNPGARPSDIGDSSEIGVPAGNGDPAASSDGGMPAPEATLSGDLQPTSSEPSPRSPAISETTTPTGRPTSRAGQDSGGPSRSDRGGEQDGEPPEGTGDAGRSIPDPAPEERPSLVSLDLRGETSGEVTEDRSTSLSGQLSIAGAAGASQVAWQILDPTSPFGILHLDADGRWTFVLDNDAPLVQRLAEGQSIVQTFAVMAVDKTGRVSATEVSVTIRGTNDAPEIGAGSVTTGAAAEDDPTQASGRLEASDIDTGASLRWSVDQTDGTYGTLSVDPDTGIWTYQIDNGRAATQGLNAGDVATDRFTVTVTDEDGATSSTTVVVSVGGGNDGPTIAKSSVVAGGVTEDAADATYSGQLLGVDPDSGAQLTWTVSATDGAYGSLSIDPATGRWTYTLDDTRVATNRLSAGQTATETFTATVTDEHGVSASQRVTVTVTGSNDLPVLAAPSPVAVDEDDPVIRGRLAATDAETPDGSLTYSTFAPVNGFTLDADGSYSFDPSDAAYQRLGLGQTTLLHIPVTVTDADGGTDTRILDITVTGTDDRPVLTVVPPMHGDEDGALIYGQLSAIYPDDGDTLTYSMPGPVNGFSLNADGSYTFDPADPAFQDLAAGEQRIIQVPVGVTDASGQTDQQTLQITVTGTNDQPVLMVTPSISTDEGASLVQGRLLAHDVDATDVPTYHPGSSVDGFVLNADGSFTFDPSHVAYDHLAPGQREVVQIPVEVRDGQGGVDSQTLQVTVVGTNDRPVFAAVVSEKLSEDSTITGRVIATDVDDGDGVTILPAAPVPGLTMAPDGSFSFDASDATYQSLGAGQTRDLTIPIIAVDRNGAQVQSQLHIQITGTDDNPIVAGLDHAMGSVQDAVAGKIHIDGQLSVLDLDAGESLFQPQLLRGSFGVLSIDPDGRWTYSADSSQPALVGLKPTDQETETFTVRTADGTQHDIELTIKGENNLAVIGGVDAGLVKEDSVTRISKQLSVIDPDAGESGFIATDHDTAHGHFSLAADGSWTFELDQRNPDVQALPDSQMITERIVVGTIDGTPHVITVNIVGTNDAPIIGAAGSGRVTEDTLGTAQGTLLANDADAGARLTWSVGSPDGAYGSLAVDPQTGAWSYALDDGNPATQALKDGETQIERFTVTVTDDQGATSQTTVTVRVTGTNDAAQISGTATGTVREDTAVDGSGLLHANGQLAITDVDTGEAAFQAETITGQYGVLTIDATGAWSFSAQNDNPDIQTLDTGNSVTDQFIVQATDGTQKVIAVRIEGLDEHVTIGGVVTGAVVEDGVTTIVHQLTTTGGAHSGESAFADTVIAGQYGSVDLRADGRWIYTLDNSNPAVQGLAEGEVRQDTITVAAKDGTTQDLTITITGAHDLPVISTSGATAARSIGSVTQIDAPTAATDLSGFAAGQTGVATGIKLTELYMPGSGTNVLDGVPDADLPAIHTQYKLAGVSGFSYLDERHWFSGRVPGVDFTALPPSTRNVWDGGVAVFSDGTVVQLQKVCEGQAGGTEKDYLYYTPYTGVTAGGGTVVSGHASAGETVEVYSGSTLLGTATADDQGGWSLGVERLADGDHALHTVIGGQPSAPQMFSLTGDTATEIPGALGLGGVTEAAPVDSVSGDLSVSDVDATDAPTFTEQTGTDGSYGTFSIDAQGHWTYQLDNSRAATQGLNEREQRTETFTVEVTTASGETVSRAVTVVVTGTNQAPTVTGDVAGALSEDGTTTTASGSLVLIDVDSGDAATATAQTGTSGTYGTFSVDADGNWTYTIDNTRAQTQGLRAGHSELDTFTVTVNDGHGGTTTQAVTVTVTGTADAPVIGGLDVGSTKEDAGSSASGVLTVTDPDSGDSAAVTAQSDVDGTYGTFSIDTNGTWSYVLDNGRAATQALSEGERQIETFTVTAVDSTGETSTHEVTIGVTGSHEAPVVSGPVDLGAINEDTILSFSAADLLSRTTMEGGGTLSIVDGSLTSSHGTITGDAASGYVFHPNADYSGQDVEIAYKVTDGTVELDTVGSLDIASVVDAAQPDLVISARQKVIEFGTGPGTGYGGVVTADPIQAGGAMHGLTVEMTFIAGQQIATSGIHGATLFSYATPSNSDTSYIWNPDDLTMRIAGHDYQTGVALPSDGRDHRITFTWDSTGGTLDLLVDGQVAKHMTGVGQGQTIPDDGKILFGNDQDSFGGGISSSDAFTGKMFSGTVAATHLDPSQLADRSVAEALSGQTGMIVDAQMDASGQLVDASGQVQLSILRDVRSTEVEVDTRIAQPNQDATLLLKPSWQAPSDTDDRVTHAWLSGLPDGTAVDDGHGHSVTIGGGVSRIDISQWSLDSITAQPPGSFHGNLNVGLEVVTEGPDGAVVETQTSMPVVYDRSLPIPDAVIGGDDTGTTDEDTSVSGQLSIADGDAGQENFTAETIQGNFGALEIQSDGSWTYTPDDRADALAAGVSDEDRLIVQSADGTTHAVTITVTGTNDGPLIAGSGDLGSVSEDGTTTTATGALTISDPDDGDTAAVVAQTDVAGTYGSFTIDENGSWTYTLDNSSAATQALADGERQQEVFTVTAIDAAGASTTHDITVTVTGSNDGPVVGGIVDLGAVDEDASGVIIRATDLLADVTDIDTAETVLTVSDLSVDGQYGSITANADGTWTFTPARDVSADDVSISFKVTDDGGAETTGQARLSISAIADGATLGVTATTAAGRAALTDGDFSTATAPINIDLTTTGYQSPGQGVTAGYYDVQDVSGGTGDDIFRFSEPTAGETYRVSGGAGRNVLDLSRFPASSVTLDTAAGTATVHLPDGDAHIAFDGITEVHFATDVFDGSPHGLIPVTGDWEVTGTGLSVAGGTAQQVALVQYSGDIATDFTLRATVNAHAHGGWNKTGGIVFDYVDEQNYKMAVLRAGQGGWNIEEYRGGQLTEHVRASDASMATPDADHDIELRVHGSVAELWSGGVMKTSHDFGTDLNGGQIGVVSDGGMSDFQLAMQPSNWAPYVPEVALQMDVQDGSITTSDLLAGATDAEGDSLRISAVDGATANGGTVVDNGDGTFSYTPPAGFSGVDTFTYTVSDGTNQTTATISVDVRDASSVSVEAGETFNLDIAAAQKDTDQSETLSTEIAGLPEGAVISDGSHSVTVGAGQGPVDVSGWDLHSVQVETPRTFAGDLTVEILTSTSEGGSRSATVSRSITAHVAAPTPNAQIYGLDTGHASADGTTSGQLTITDAQSGDALFRADVLDGTYGSLTIDEDGRWAFAADGRADALADGDQQVDRFTVRSVDGTEHVITIGLTGANDAPTVTAIDAGHAANLGATAEDTPKTFSQAELLQMVGAHDPDTGDTMEITNVDIDPAAGSFSKGSDGSWTLTPAANFDGTHVPISIEVSDGQATMTAHAIVDVTPVADAPGISLALGDAVPLTTAVSLASEVGVTVAQPFLGDPSQDFGDLLGQAVLFGDLADLAQLKAVIAGGTLLPLGATIHDPVHGDGIIVEGGASCSAFAANSGDGSVKLIFETGGPAQMNLSMHYVGAEEYLDEMCGWGDFTVDRSTGGDSGGSANQFSATVAEDQDIPLTITLGDLDPSKTLDLTIAGIPAGATLSAGTANPDGTWSLAPAELPGLRIVPPEDFKGTVNLEVTATSTDHADTASTTVRLDITVTPVAETPTITANDPRAVDEDAGAPIPLDIQLDVHHDATETLALHIEGVPDDATLSAGSRNADGTWSLDPADLGGLSVTPGDQFSGVMALTVVATSTEATGESASARLPVLVNVHPVIDTTLAVQDLMVSRDDASHGIALPVTLRNWGLDPSESFTTPSGALAIPAGDDVPPFSLHQSGRLYVELPDGASQSSGWQVHTGHGGLFILDWTKPGGSTVPIVSVSPEQVSQLSVTPPSDFSGDISLRVVGTVSDGTAQADIDMPFSIHVGAPVSDATIHGLDTASVNQSGTASGILAVSDDDAGEAAFQAADLDGSHGSLSIDSDGNWTYTADERADALAEGEQQVDRFTVRSVDGTEHVINIGLTGTNDAPTIADVGDGGSVDADAPATVSGTLQVSDVDTGDTATVVEQTDTEGTYGSFSVQSDGSWTYEIDPAKVLALADGETQTDRFTVEATDNEGASTSHDVTIDVTGGVGGGAVAGAPPAGLDMIDDQAVADPSGAAGVDEAQLPPATAEDVNLDASTNTGDVASSVADYMSFASTGQTDAADQPGDDTASADGDSSGGVQVTGVSDYLSAAGVDPDQLDPGSHADPSALGSLDGGDMAVGGAPDPTADGGDPTADDLMVDVADLPDSFADDDPAQHSGV